MKKTLLFTALLLLGGLINANAQYTIFSEDAVAEGSTLTNAAAGSVNLVTTDEFFTGASSIQMNFPGMPPAAVGWCMLLITNATGVDLSEYADGYLNFAMKTTSLGGFNLRITDGTNKPKIFFVDGADPYGFVRDGEWHKVSIPIQDFVNATVWQSGTTDAFNLAAIKDLFVWRSGAENGDADWAAATPADIFFDDISVSKTPWPAETGGNYLFAFENATDVDNWNPFANGPAGAKTDIVVIPNPSKSGKNTSANSLQFTVNPDADPWVGMANTIDLVGDKALVFTEENHTLTMMVYKTLISPVLLKLEKGLDAAANIEVKVPNTLINEWEVISFDFTGAIGKTYESLVAFPDFPDARTEGAITLLDNIAWADGTVSAPAPQSLSLSVYPNPASSVITVNGVSSLQAKVISITGQVVKSVNQKSNQLNVSGLHKGVYLLSGKSEGKPYVLKFIKN